MNNIWGENRNKWIGLLKLVRHTNSHRTNRDNDSKNYFKTLILRP
jgi:hypothetical protein